MAGVSARLALAHACDVLFTTDAGTPGSPTGSAAGLAFGVGAGYAQNSIVRRDQTDIASVCARSSLFCFARMQWTMDLTTGKISPNYVNTDGCECFPSAPVNLL